MSPSRQVGVSRGPVEPDGFFRDSAVCGIAFAFCAHDSLRTDYQGLEAIDVASLGAIIIPVSPTMVVGGSHLGLCQMV